MFVSYDFTTIPLEPLLSTKKEQKEAQSIKLKEEIVQELEWR